MEKLDNFISNYKSSFPKLIDDFPHILQNTNLLLKDISDYVDIQYTYGEVNRQVVYNSEKRIEIYISPKYNKRNIKYVKYIFDKLHKYLPIYMYRPFYKEEIFEKIEMYDITLYNKDLKVQTSISIEDDNYLLNLCINVNPKLNILENKEVIFENKKRNVLLPKNDIILIALDNILGEYNMLNLIGYIEYISDENTENFNYLESIRDDIEVVRKHNNMQYCNYCNRVNHTTKLLNCSCKKIKYCSVYCQKNDWKNHKRIH